MVDVSLLEQLSAEAECDGVRQFVFGAVAQHSEKVLLLQRPDVGGIEVAPHLREGALHRAAGIRRTGPAA